MPRPLAAEASGGSGGDDAVAPAAWGNLAGTLVVRVHAENAINRFFDDVLGEAAVPFGGRRPGRRTWTGPPRTCGWR